MQPKLGTPAGAGMSADIAAVKGDSAAILVDTAEIGAAGAGLTALATAAQATAIEADTQDLQSRIPAALVGGRIDATVDATGMEAGAVAAIADGVWDEALSGHVTAGSAGAYLGDVVDAATAAATIADAVWDEAQSGHVTAGTFGEVATEVAAILVDTAEIGAAGAGLTALATAAQATAIEADTQDLQSRLPAALVGGRIDATVDGTGLEAAAAAVIADAVWDEDLSGHVTSGTAGQTLGDVATGTPPTAAAIADAVWEEALADHSATVGSTAEALDAAQAGGGLDAAGVRAAVGLAAANLDTQLGTIDANVDAVLVDTADMQPKLGTPAGASVSADIAAVKAETASILTDTAEIGAAGAGLTALATAAAAAAIEADTQDLQSRIPAALSGGRMASDAAAVGGSTTAASRLAVHAVAVVQVVVGSGSTPTSIVLDASTGINGGAPPATDDTFNGRVLVITSGDLLHQATDISDYNGSTGVLTVTGLTGSAAAGVTGVIV
ncbi:MAG: hypothetical protein R2708_27830 [Vicinamibacterales bacterium]